MTAMNLTAAARDDDPLIMALLKSHHVLHLQYGCLSQFRGHNGYHGILFSTFVCRS
jgi:hypothetical protein